MLRFQAMPHWMKPGVKLSGRCLVAALPSDAENLYTVLSAKSLNPQISDRACQHRSLQKLERAGADAVVSHITGGKRISAALRPQVMDFVDGFSRVQVELYLENFCSIQSFVPAWVKP